MEKYEISSFLVTKTAKKLPEDSPRIKPQSKKIIEGILTNRDINCFKFNDDKVKDYMTPFNKIVYHEVASDF